MKNLIQAFALILFLSLVMLLTRTVTYEDAALCSAFAALMVFTMVLTAMWPEHHKWTVSVPVLFFAFIILFGASLVYNKKLTHKKHLFHYGTGVFRYLTIKLK